MYSPRAPTFASLDPSLPPLTPLLESAIRTNLNIDLSTPTPLSALDGMADSPDSLHDNEPDAGSGAVVKRLFAHQAKALNGLLGGQHLSLSTETSSGKSLVYVQIANEQ